MKTAIWTQGYIVNYLNLKNEILSTMIEASSLEELYEKFADIPGFVRVMTYPEKTYWKVA